MNNRGRGKTSHSVSNLANLGHQRKAIGEYQAKRVTKGKVKPIPISSTPTTRKTGDGFKIHNYADVKRVGKRLGPNDQFGNQTLQPTPSARSATLTDFKTPKGVPKAKLKTLFGGKGLDVSKIT